MFRFPPPPTSLQPALDECPSSRAGWRFPELPDSDACSAERPLTELDSGAVKTIPWAEVRRRLARPMPPFAVDVHPLAADEAEAAERWYRERNETASARFRREFISPMNSSQNSLTDLGAATSPEVRAGRAARPHRVEWSASPDCLSRIEMSILNATTLHETGDEETPSTRAEPLRSSGRPATRPMVIRTVSL